MFNVEKHINFESKRVNFIALAARGGHVETKWFIRKSGITAIEKEAEREATKIIERLPKIGKDEVVKGLLRQATTVFLMSYMGLLEKMELSKEFTVFYNIVAVAYGKDEMQLDSEVA